MKKAYLSLLKKEIDPDKIKSLPHAASTIHQNAKLSSR